MKNLLHNKKHFIVEMLIIIVVIIIICVAYILLQEDPILSEITVEAGSEINIEQFYAHEDDDIEATFQTELTAEELKTPGIYEVIIECKNKEYTVKVTVEDTIAPTAVLKDVEVYVDDEISTDMFVEEYDDVTDVEISFKNDVSTHEAGKQEIILDFTDTSGNIGEYSAYLNVIEDTEAPVFSGLSDISITVGDTIKYKSGVSVSDNHDEDVEYEVDSSNVNTNKAGTYEAIYTATDAAGNTAKETRKVTVKAVSSTLDSVNALADDVLSSIITSSMSDYQKIRAIYNWVRGHISYADGTDKPAYYVAAYKGFTKRTGDCYVYWATSKILLTRAGISNIDIKKSDTSVSGHYWSLVNIGEGWHHFDTTPRKGGFDGFYLTDAQLKAYSEAHNNSHVYDASLYPDIE